MTTKARRAKDLRLRREFHITLEQFDKVLKFQGGGCAICKKQVNKEGEKLKLAVDHDHKTGLVRGIVCLRCNKGMALFLDIASNLFNAYNYLEAPPFERVFGHKFYTAPGKIGTKVRKKHLAVFNAAREKDGKETELQKRKSGKKQESI